jgi:hypothetical protein
LPIYAVNHVIRAVFRESAVVNLWGSILIIYSTTVPTIVAPEDTALYSGAASHNLDGTSGVSGVVFVMVVVHVTMHHRQALQH